MISHPHPSRQQPVRSVVLVAFVHPKHGQFQARIATAARLRAHSVFVGKHPINSTADDQRIGLPPHTLGNLVSRVAVRPHRSQGCAVPSRRLPTRQATLGSEVDGLECLQMAGTVVSMLMHAPLVQKSSKTAGRARTEPFHNAWRWYIEDDGLIGIHRQSVVLAQLALQLPFTPR